MYSVWYERPDGEVVRINSKESPQYKTRDGLVYCTVERFKFVVSLDKFCLEYVGEEKSRHEKEMEELLRK